MNERLAKRGNRQVGIAECILEGKTVKEAAREYNIGVTTAREDLIELFCYGYGTTQEQRKQNKILAYKAFQELERRRKKKK